MVSFLMRDEVYYKQAAERNMKIVFEWDRHKAQTNRHKHKVGFEEAQSVFLDPFLVTVRDEEHS
jgi:uncharacterized DUF497 family protein